MKKEHLKKRSGNKKAWIFGSRGSDSAERSDARDREHAPPSGTRSDAHGDGSGVQNKSIIEDYCKI